MKKTVQNYLKKRQICPKFIHLIMESNHSHKSIANSTLYNVSIRVFPLSSHIFIWTCPVCFSVTKLPSATSIFLSVYTNDSGIKYWISGVMWQVAPESKIQLVSCEMSPKYLLVISMLVYIHAIDSYIFCDSLSSVIFPASYLFSLICTQEL